jgi:hypothetical protein
MNILQKTKNFIKVYGWPMFIRRILSLPLLSVAVVAMIIADCLWCTTMFCIGDYKEMRRAWHGLYR